MLQWETCSNQGHLLCVLINCLNDIYDKVKYKVKKTNRFLRKFGKQFVFVSQKGVNKNVFFIEMMIIKRFSKAWLLFWVYTHAGGEPPWTVSQRVGAEMSDLILLKMFFHLFWLNAKFMFEFPLCGSADSDSSRLLQLPRHIQGVAAACVGPVTWREWGNCTPC